MKKLFTFTKVIYGFGDISFSYAGTIIAAYFPIFLTDVVGIIFAFLYPLSRADHHNVVDELATRRKQTLSAQSQEEVV